REKPEHGTSSPERRGRRFTAERRARARVGSNRCASPARTERERRRHSLPRERVRTTPIRRAEEHAREASPDRRQTLVTPRRLRRTLKVALLRENRTHVGAHVERRRQENAARVHLDCVE